jgi:hypothetical protein
MAVYAFFRILNIWGMITFTVEFFGNLKNTSRAISDAKSTSLASLGKDHNFPLTQPLAGHIKGSAPEFHLYLTT